MIKTLRITSIIAAVLAAIFLISLVLFGTGSNKQVKQYLNSESVIEKFNKAESSKEATGGQVSPLIIQARDFAKYLNPPAKPKPAAPPPSTQGPSVPTPRPSTVSAKFTLVGTSYYNSQPERSLAFINEPGKGLRWVTQSSEVGHLIIEQVKDGLVVVRDGQRTFELTIPEMLQRSLIEGASAVPATALDRTARKLPADASYEDSAKTSISEPPKPSEEEIAMIEKFMESINKGTDSNNTGADLEKMMSDLGSMRMSTNEANRLKHLPNELTNAQEPPAPVIQDEERITADPNQPRSPKVQKPPVRARRPSRPATR